MKQKRFVLFIFMLSLNMVTLLAQTFNNPLINAPSINQRNYAQQVPVVYGTVIANMQGDTTQYGLYSISTAKNSKLTKITEAPSGIIANGGGIYLDGVYRFVNYNIWTEATTYYEYDTKTWKQLKKEILPDKTNVGIDEAYDPTTGNTYGCFTDANGSDYVFGYVDHDSHQRTFISKPSVLYFAVAVSPEGIVYAIGSDGVLYKIDKTSGKETKIGSTGILPKYYQSAVFDMQSGKMYWAACNTNGASGLYEVNTETGKATLINGFSSKEQLTGIYIPFDRAKADAPAEVDSLSTTFVGPSLSGTVSFTMPTTTYSGNELSGDLSYKLLLNGSEYATASAQPGEKVTVNLTGADGSNTISVCALNHTGNGPIKKVYKWLGYDAPRMTKPLLEYDGDKTLTLSWERPTEALHNGYLDTANIRYNVIRYPGEITVATNFANNKLSQKLSPKQYTKYYYKVSAISHNLNSGESTSNAIGFGQAYDIPFSEDFSSNYTDYFNKEDDWLITPALDMTNQNVYNITLDATNTGSDNAEIEIYMGNGSSPKDMTQRLSKNTLKAGTSSRIITYMYSSTPSNSFIGIKTVSQVSLTKLWVVKGTTAEAPDSVKQLRATCEKGKSEVKFTFTTPSTTINGKPLASLNSVKIMCDSAEIGSINHVTPGQSCSVTYNDTFNGMRNYTVYAVSEKGDGMPSVVSLFVGTDIPTSPGNVKLVDANGTAHISWTAPNIGMNGEDIAPSQLTYDILRNDNQLVAHDISGTSFDDTSVDLNTSNQQFCQYAVKAKTVAGSSDYAMSNPIVKGAPYDLPFHESFPNGSLSYGFWGTDGIGAKWSISSNTSSDNDGGCALFNPSRAEGSSTLYSGKINIAGLSSVKLDYDCYVTPGSNTKLLVELRRPDMTVVKVDSIDMSTMSGTKGWKKRFVNISTTDAGNYCHILFHAISGDGVTNVYVDNISLDRTFDYDLDAVISVPTEVRAGSKANIQAIVRNVGGKVYPYSYAASLVVDGAVYETQSGSSLAQNATNSFDFVFPVPVFFEGQHTLSIELTADEDEQQSNNLSSEVAVKVLPSILPTVGNLQWKQDSQYRTMTWSAPNLEGEIVNYDDVESYQPFAIDNVGDWTMVDVDGSYTYGIASGDSYVDFPHAIEPKSWIVFNAPESGAIIYDNGGRPTGWKPRSGDQMFISFQDADGVTDDWMISPELPGYKQTLSFYVKSINPATHGFETFEVLYSTTDKDLSSFRQITDIIGEAPADWTEVKADLPEGTKYFAIRGTSVGHFALLLDDITYSIMKKEDLHLEGYNIYADMHKLNDSPISNLQYTLDNKIEASRIDVTAVYAEGQSAPITLSLADGIVSNALSQADISCSDGSLHISGLFGNTVSVWTISGQLFYTNKVQGSLSLPLPKGVYIVGIDGTNKKVTIQ